MRATQRSGGIRVWMVAAAMLALGSIADRACAFPGVIVARDDARRVVHATQWVLVRHPQAAVVTVMPDYEGPLTPFAMVMPVPSDVTLDHVATVKREFITRVEEVSAPRYHTFYEQDPCAPGPVQQQWEYHIRAEGVGFLGAGVPPADTHATVPKELSIPIKPVFKGPESEFSYHVLRAQQIAELRSWLQSRGYRLAEPAARALERVLTSGMWLLVAEVNVNRVELLASDRAQLGGIRYWTRHRAPRVHAQLGLLNAPSIQDLTIYVLDRQHRFEVKNYGNCFAPTNIVIDLNSKERLAELYNTLYDRVAKRQPGAFVHEYAWPTTGCGEPCANAPLQLRELLSLGGDVLEAEPGVKTAPPPPLPPETQPEQERFLRELQQLQPAERRRARSERRRDRRMLARRRGLISRHRYVLSRMHYRYTAESLPHAVELGPAAHHVRGGVDIPQGLAGQLPQAVVQADTSQYQVRFVHTLLWSRPTTCEKPQRGRWGRRWDSLGHTWHKPWFALDLPRQKRGSDLARAVQTPLPELGLPARATSPRREGTAASPQRAADSGCGCALGISGTRPPGAGAWLLVAALLPLARSLGRDSDFR